MNATAPVQTEKQFQAAVVDFARLSGWGVYHTFDSRRSEPGFPDLVMVRSGRLVFAELKAEKGRVSRVQQDWLDALSDVRIAQLEHVGGPAGGIACPARAVEVFVWRPSLWTEIETVLR